MNVLFLGVMSVCTRAQEMVVRVWWHGHHGPHPHGQQDHGTHDHGHGGTDHGPQGHTQNDLGGMVIGWEEGFRKLHPEVRFENDDVGDESALGGLYTGAADVAVMDRPPLAIEVDGYQQGEGRDPVGVAVATGSVRKLHDAPALAVVVAPGNPMRAISLAQLDAVFDADHRRGMERVHVWGDLGLTGAWANRPVRLYGFGINHEESFLFERDVMKGSQKWREGLHELDRPADVCAAVANDPDGIGITSMDGVNPGVRVLAVQDEHGNAVKPTPEALRGGHYPLERTLYAYFKGDVKDPAQKVVREFLQYSVSEEGQASVETSGFLPLSAEAAQASREALAK